MGLIIGYLSLVSLRCFHPNTLAYVTSRVLRPPWGREIKRYPWQFSLGRAYVDWLKYSRYYVFSYGKYFWKHLVSLSYLVYRCLLDFWVGDNQLIMLDSSFCCALDIHTGAYFPFALRSLVVVGLCGYPWSWSLRCLIDVIKWLIDVDRCLVNDVMFFIVYQISILGHIPLSSMRLYEDGWSLLVVFLMTPTSDTILGHTVLLDEILFVWWYEDGWLMLVVYLMTLTLDLILGHISPFSFSILEIGTTTNLF